MERKMTPRRRVASPPGSKNAASPEAKAERDRLMDGFFELDARQQRLLLDLALRLGGGHVTQAVSLFLEALDT